MTVKEIIGEMEGRLADIEEKQIKGKNITHQDGDALEFYREYIQKLKEALNEGRT